jgi:hypothetical protein
MNPKPGQPLSEDDPTIPAIRDFWLERGKGLVKESINTIDETARQIIAIAGILEGLYFHAIAFSDLRGTLKIDWLLGAFLFPILALLLSLIAALMVFFPKRYDLEMRSWEAAKLVYERTLSRKLLMLKIAALFLVLGVAGLLAVMLLYLLG